MRLLFTGGGTAGHVLPALSVWEYLPDNWQYHWIGSHRGVEKSILQGIDAIEYHSIPTGKLRRYFSWQNFVDPFKVLAGIFTAYSLLRKIQPDLIFSKGGFVSVPVAVAAKLLKIPFLSHESDLEPGLATRINLRFSSVLILSYQKSLPYLKKEDREKSVVLGNPIRRDFFSPTSLDIRSLWNISPELPIVVAQGGSLGSQRLNELVLGMLDTLAGKAFVIHLMGEKGFQPREERYYRSFSYLNEEMIPLLQEAEIAISRSGAGSLWELAVSDTAMILLPLGSASSRGDQIQNAKLLEEAGAAHVFDESETDSLEVGKLLNQLLEKKSERDLLKENAKKFLGIQAKDEEKNPSKKIASLILSKLSDV